MRNRTSFALALALIAAAPAAGQDRILASGRPPATACPAGGPLQVWLLQQSSATDCDNTVSGTTDALCCCNNSTWGACATSSGGSGTVTSVALAVPAEWSVSGSPVTTSGTITISEATQSANTIYAGPTTGGAAAPAFRALVSADIPNNAANTSGTAGALTANGSNCSAGQYARGVDAAGAAENCTADADTDTKVVLDFGDDGGNDSAGLIEFSTLADDYQVLTEPSADEAQVDFAKLPPYRQYDPNRPPSSCNTCDEFTGGSTITFNGWGNQESSTVTAARDGLTLFHPTDSTGQAVYWFTGPDGSSADWVFHARVTLSSMTSFNQTGIMLLATGTEGTPTLIYEIVLFQSSGAVTPRVGARSATSLTAAQTALGNDQFALHSAFVAMGYVTSTKELTFYYSPDGYLYTAIHTATLAAHPTTSFGLQVASLSTTQPSYGFFHFVRVRTDAGRLEVGE